MAFKDPNRCLICDQNRSHGGNKALAAKHSRMTKEKAERGELPQTVWQEKRYFFPDHFDFKNGKRVVV